MSKAIIALAILLTSMNARAQTFSMTPHIDSIEISTGISANHVIKPSPLQYDYKWDNEAPLLVSLGVLAICVTVIVLATTASSNDRSDLPDATLTNPR